VIPEKEKNRLTNLLYNSSNSRSMQKISKVSQSMHIIALVTYVLFMLFSASQILLFHNYILKSRNNYINKL